MQSARRGLQAVGRPDAYSAEDLQRDQTAYATDKQLVFSQLGLLSGAYRSLAFDAKTVAAGLAYAAYEMLYTKVDTAQKDLSERYALAVLERGTAVLKDEATVFAQAELAKLGEKRDEYVALRRTFDEHGQEMDHHITNVQQLWLGNTDVTRDSAEASASEVYQRYTPLNATAQQLEAVQAQFLAINAGLMAFLQNPDNLKPRLSQLIERDMGDF